MASISDMLLGLGNQRFQQQNRDWNNFIKPLLIALGLKDPEQAMSVLGPIFQQMFAQDVEQIGQSFAGGRIGLTDALASSGFRTGSQAAALNQSYLGQAQSEVMAKRARLSEQLQSLFAGGQIATNMYGQMNPGQFYQSAADFYQPSGISPWWGIAQALLGAGGGAMQGLLSNPGAGGTPS